MTLLPSGLLLRGEEWTRIEIVWPSFYGTNFLKVDFLFAVCSLAHVPSPYLSSIEVRSASNGLLAALVAVAPAHPSAVSSLVCGI